MKNSVTDAMITHRSTMRSQARYDNVSDARSIVNSISISDITAFIDAGDGESIEIWADGSVNVGMDSNIGGWEYDPEYPYDSPMYTISCVSDTLEDVDSGDIDFYRDYLIDLIEHSYYNL